MSETVRRRVWEPLETRFGVPTARQLSDGHRVETSAADFVRALHTDADIAALRDEHATTRAALQQRRQSERLVYGDTFAVQDGTSFVLHAMIRLERPIHVLETGVADGVSSYVMLAALALNGEGTLHSTDIRPDAGVLVEDASRWDRFLLDRRFPARSLATYVSSLPDLDLFVHDSLHRRSWHLRELRLAYERLRPGGILASDDVDSSFAFRDFCASVGMEPVYLFDRTKFFAAARKS
jgi:hypothetical protein